MTFSDPIHEGDQLLIAEPDPEPLVIPFKKVPVGRQYSQPSNTIYEMLK